MSKSLRRQARMIKTSLEQIDTFKIKHSRLHRRASAPALEPARTPSERAVARRGEAASRARRF
jgi:hypothetical protein